MSDNKSLKNISIEKFSASDGVLHYALFSLPPKKSVKTAIIHIHGLTGSFYGSTGIEEMAESSRSKGFAFMSIQTRGSYIINRFDKLKSSKRSSLFAGSALEKFEDCVYDIKGAVDFLVDKGYKNIFLEGHSTGCQKIVYYISKKRDNRIKGLILLSPTDDYNYEKAVQGRKFGKNFRFARNVTKGNGNSLMPDMPTDMILSASRFLSVADPKRPESRIFNYRMDDMEYISKINLPVLAILGEKDYFMNTAKISASYAIDKLQKNCKFLEGVTIKNTDHWFHGKRNTLTKLVLAWIEKRV